MRAIPSEARKEGKSTQAGSGCRRRLGLLGCCGLVLAMATSTIFGEGRSRKAAKGNADAVRPEVRIPVASLGYMAPGELPEFGYEAMVELHFLDAGHLLFSFNIDGLLRRSDSCPTAVTQRKVRAVVLAIPSGKVEKQTEWQLFHFTDYLWALGNGQFLLRRCSDLDVVGASLDPQSVVHAVGEIEAVGFSPDRSTMMVEEKSEEPRKAVKPTNNPVFGPGGPTAEPVVASFIRLHPLQIVTSARLPFPAAVPILHQGILELLSGLKSSWTVDLLPFPGMEPGGERKIAEIHSACQPTLTPISSGVIAAGVCGHGGKRIFEGYDTSGLLLWRIPVGDDRDYPRFLLTRNGVHFAIESLHAKRPLAALDPLSNKVIDGEIVDIYDTTTGVLIGSLKIEPAFTAGRNADFSPDGTRIAVLDQGAIDIYSLSELGKAPR